MGSFWDRAMPYANIPQTHCVTLLSLMLSLPITQTLTPTQTQSLTLIFPINLTQSHTLTFRVTDFEL